MGLPKGNMFYGLRDKLTDEQLVYIDSVYKNKVTVVDAIAGAGKTFVGVALSRIMGRELVYIHPAVEERTLGFTGGSPEEKMAKYQQPLYDALIKMGENPIDAIYSKDPALKDKQKKAWVHAQSDTYLRGSTLDGNKVVLIDEAQNFTYSQLRKILTRITDSCIVIIVGHHEQCDLPNPKHSGFIPYLNFYKTRNYAKVCKLSVNHRGIIASDADIPYEKLLEYSNGMEEIA